MSEPLDHYHPEEMCTCNVPSGLECPVHHAPEPLDLEWLKERVEEHLARSPLESWAMAVSPHALLALIAAAEESYEWEMSAKSNAVALDGAAEEILRLREERDRLREGLEHIYMQDGHRRDGTEKCSWCWVYGPEHVEWCPASTARAALDKEDR